MDILNYLRQLFFGKTKTQPIATTTKVEIEELPSTEEQDIDCDFCTMFGDDECCLHRTTKVFGMAMLTKASIVNSDKKCKGDRWTFAEYKAVIARDKTRLNKIINGH